MIYRILASLIMIWLVLAAITLWFDWLIKMPAWVYVPSSFVGLLVFVAIGGFSIITIWEKL